MPGRHHRPATTRPVIRRMRATSAGLQVMVSEALMRDWPAPMRRWPQSRPGRARRGAPWRPTQVRYALPRAARRPGEPPPPHAHRSIGVGGRRRFRRRTGRQRGLAAPALMRQPGSPGCQRARSRFGFGCGRQESGSKDNTLCSRGLKSRNRQGRDGRQDVDQAANGTCDQLR